MIETEQHTIDLTDLERDALQIIVKAAYRDLYQATPTHLFVDLIGGIAQKLGVHMEAAPQPRGRRRRR